VIITPNEEEGFAVEEGEIENQFVLTSTGTSGQYYISYNDYYLTRSTSSWGSGNKAITWSSSQSSNNRWTINANGISQTASSGWGGSTTYYLFYNGGSFYTGTSNNNNITFYQEGDCPTEQAVNLGPDWNWWTPTIEMSLDDLEDALGSDAVLINSQNEGFVRYDGESWSGTLTDIEPGKMYKIQSGTSRSLTLTGQQATVDSLTVQQGYNWFGYAGTTTATIGEALSSMGVSPSNGDKIIDQNGASATYEDGTWTGTLIDLMPGKGYVYVSYHSEQ